MRQLQAPYPVNELSDISTLVLSMSEIMRKLNSILADSVILDLNMDIAALGQDVEELIGVETGEISGRSFGSICADSDVLERLRVNLQAGYFVDMDANLWTSNGETCKAALSGFYLGLISDINGYIILKIKLKEDNSILKKELFTKKRELDTFIYRTAHDLRGPLATIKGLVNLLKIRKTDLEVDKLTSLIEVHADKLDDRLFKLLYLANDNGHYDDGKGCLDFHLLKETLIKTLKDNCQLDQAIFAFEGPVSKVCQVNDRAIVRMVRHALLYVIGLPVATTDSDLEISLTFRNEARAVSLRMNARGFIVGEQLRQVIQKPTSLYNDLLTHPLLFNYYVAYKEAMLLGASCRVNFLSDSHQIFDVMIPIGQNKIKNQKSKI